MRLLLLFLAILNGICVLPGQNKPILPKNFVAIPGGSTLDMNGKPVSILPFYMCTAEVTNLEYQAFLSDLLRRKKSSEHTAAQIHPEGWNLLHAEFVHYHTLPDYQDYPVVNISQEGARMYCAWLTETYSSQNPDYTVTFRLPTETEWRYAAHGGLPDSVPYPHGHYLRGGDGQFLYNFRVIGDESIHYDRKTQIYRIQHPSRRGLPSIGPNISPAQVFKPNAYGLHNTSGNVAEMLAATGRTKGGCFNSTGYDIRIDAPDEFSGFSEPSPYIGFRPVVVVERRQK